MNRPVAVMIGSLACVAGFLWMLAKMEKESSHRSHKPTEPLVLFCAASNRSPMEKIRSEYEKEYGKSIQIQYGPSQTLLSSMEVSQTGDLYLPADDSFIEMAAEKGLIQEVIPIATMQAVVAVQRGNPKGIQGYEDLLKKDVRLVQASVDASAIGRVTKKVLGERGLWDQIDAHTESYRTTVTDAVNDVVVGAADAAIVYDAVVSGMESIETIPLPELDKASSQVSVSIVRSSKQAQAALHFARFLTARDRGLIHYKQHGFQVGLGDEWKDVPELSLFAGSMLRPAIDETITSFEKREGIKVSRVYNGCGILVAQMKAGQHPDAYFACDKEFMNQVPDLFPDPIDISGNRLVILVQKGNPKKISELRDLGRAGLRVGIGHEKQCAMGWLTQNTLREGGVQTEVMANVTVQTPTGDMLVNQLQAGSLDAAVAYLSNAAGKEDVLEAIVIEGIPCSNAVQPFAVANDTKFPRLASRLLECLKSSESQSSFASEGFTWMLGMKRDSKDDR